MPSLKPTGYSYVEVLVAMGLIAVALIPAMNALRTGVTATTVNELETRRQLAVTSRLETVLAEPYAALDAEALAVGDPTTPTSYSDAGGSPDRLLVYLSRYDADNADADDDPFTGMDSGLVWVRVAMEDTILAIDTLVANP